MTKVYGKMMVPCGRCPACRRRKQNEWAFRILEESKSSRLSCFITLTIDDDHLTFSPSGVATLDPKRFTKFCKDLRYRFPFRFFGCGEYGDSFERPHYHLCLFTNSNLTVDEITSFVQKCWPDGLVKVDCPLTAGRAKYCAKYSMKQIGFDYGDVVPPFARMSRRPGIGKQFLNSLDIDKFRMLKQWAVHDYQGTPYNLPRYYKERIYSKDEIDQHSMLLEKLKNSDLDLNIRNYDNFFKFEAERINNLERLFIKHLKKENYGFKYTLKKHERKRFTQSSDEFSSSEFDS